jgi:signal transduction histidine kinase
VSHLSSVARIVRDALGSASPPIRRRIAWMGVGWLAMLAVQAWDSRDGRGAAGVAELLSVILGVSGVGLLGLAHALHQAMDEAAARPRPPGEAEGVQKVLLALPVLGFAAGVALGAAALLMVVRGVLGAPWPFVLGATAVYLGMLGLAVGTVTGSVQTLYRHAVREAQAAADLRDAAAAARLAALQARMNPHFLFNALNTVAALVRSDPPAAERVVEDLGKVLRQTLARSTATTTTVREEVEYVRAYLAIEQERWGDSLRVRWEVAEASLSCELPPLVLQPLVENALRHGLGTRMEGGTIVITVALRDDALLVRVEDDGEGFRANWREGTGLGNLRQRLQTACGAAASLEVRSADGGARVTAMLPKRAPRPSAAERGN